MARKLGQAVVMPCAVGVGGHEWLAVKKSVKRQEHLNLVDHSVLARETGIGTRHGIFFRYR